MSGPLDVAMALAQAAGDRLLQAFGPAQPATSKGDASNVVTDADLASERLIVDGLRRAFPDDGLIAEESGWHAGRSGFTWVVDPLDGTSNYAAGIPWFGVLIARLHGDVPVLGVLHLPVERATLTARRGEGARRDGRPIRVSDATALSEVLWAWGMDGRPTVAETARDLHLLAALLARVRNVRATNSLVDAALTADGRLGGMLNQSTRLWDIAAPMLIIAEAGGRYTGLDGAPLTLDVSPHAPDRVYAVLAGAPALHAAVAALVRG